MTVRTLGLVVLVACWIGFAAFCGVETARAGYESGLTGFVGGLIVFPLLPLCAGVVIAAVGWFLAMIGPLLLTLFGLVRVLEGSSGGGWLLAIGVILLALGGVGKSAAGEGIATLADGATFFFRFWRL